MQLVEKRGHYYVYDGNTVLIKTNDKAEAESLLASSGDSNGSKEKKDNGEKKDSKAKNNFQASNSKTSIGIGKKDTANKSKKK